MTSRGNRSTGTVGDYLLMITQGYTVEEVGSQFGITGGAVRKALQRQRLPTCALDYLRWLRSAPSVTVQSESPKPWPITNCAGPLTDCDMKD